MPSGTQDFIHCQLGLNIMKCPDTGLCRINVVEDNCPFKYELSPGDMITAVGSIVVQCLTINEIIAALKSGTTGSRTTLTTKLTTTD